MRRMATLMDNAGRNVTTTFRVSPAAYWLSVTGMIFQGISAVLIVSMFLFFVPSTGMMGGFYWGMMGPYARIPWFGWMSGVWLITLAVVIGLGIFGLMWMGSRDAERIRGGAIMVLIAAVVSFPTMWGFGVGSILMLVGAILGLTTTIRVQT